MQGSGEARAVFVDPTGRRGRLVARTCWLLGALGTAYVALVLISLLLPPGLARLTVPGLGAVLPGPAAAPLGAVRGDAPEVLLAPLPTARPSTRPTTSPRPTTAPARRPSAASSPPVVERTTAPRPTNASTRAPAAPPGRPTAAPPGRPTTAPTRRAPQATAAPPGSTRTPKPRPSQTRGPR